MLLFSSKFAVNAAVCDWAVCAGGIGACRVTCAYSLPGFVSFAVCRQNMYINIYVGFWITAFFPWHVWKKALKIRNEMFPNLPAFLEHGLIKRKHYYEIAASLLCLTFPLEGCLPSHLLPRRASPPSRAADRANEQLLSRWLSRASASLHWLPDWLRKWLTSPAARCSLPEPVRRWASEQGCWSSQRQTPRTLQTYKKNVSGHLLENELRTSIETNQGLRLLNLQKVLLLSMC